MNFKISKSALLLGLGLFGANILPAQEIVTNAKDSKYEFTVIKNLEALPVQDQFKTATCWSFSALGFFESEIIRQGNGEHNLSEMFVVNHTYKDKAEMYARMHGTSNFGPGGAFHDIPHVWEKYGIVPEEVYTGLNYGTTKHDHSQLNKLVENYMEAVLKDEKELANGWQRGFDAMVSSYLGEVPKEFEYKGKKYTPKSYAASLGLNMEDYIALSSFTHHPYYKQFVLEVPDNWLYKSMWNITLDELMDVMENSIQNGYTFAWAADVSEKTFNYKKGIAVLPEDDSNLQQKGKDSQYFNDAGADRTGDAFMQPVPEKDVTAEMRQQGFDNWQTTDDHGMQITGLVKDQLGRPFYIVKNSWGNTNNDCDGYFYVSEPYMRMKTINILVHKDAIPKEIRKKIGL